MIKKLGPKEMRRQASMTHEEIANKLGVSRATILDIEKRALKKVREALFKRGIKMDDYFG
jgi:DNA-binding XRE family transcriptional regulator